MIPRRVPMWLCSETSNDVLNQINLYSYQVRPCYDACNYHPNRIRQTLTHQVQVQQKKNGWFHFVSISLSLECYLRISPFFYTATPLASCSNSLENSFSLENPLKESYIFPFKLPFLLQNSPTNEIAGQELKAILQGLDSRDEATLGFQRYAELMVVEWDYNGTYWDYNGIIMGVYWDLSRTMW